MADPSDLRAIQCQQRDAMDPVQHNYKHHNDVLQCVQLLRGHDQHDLHDNLYSVHFSSELSPRQICKYQSPNLPRINCVLVPLSYFLTTDYCDSYINNSSWLIGKSINDSI